MLLQKLKNASTVNPFANKILIIFYYNIINLIAINKNLQRKGIGAEMMTYVESLLREKGSRILIVETSGLPEFGLTREFYDKLGYKREAVIREFHQEGEDKVVFEKN